METVSPHSAGVVADRGRTAIEGHSLMLEPIGVSVQAQTGESVMGVALRHGYSWPTICHGDGTCTICWVLVTAGEDNLTEASPDEQEALQGLAARLNQPIRLACQARVVGDVEVFKKGVRRRLALTDGAGEVSDRDCRIREES